MILAKLLRGFMDGALSTLGIVIGAYAAAGPVIIAAAIGGTLANGISNALSAYSASEAEQYSEMRSIEDAMVARELKGSAIERKIRRDNLLASVADGMATLIGGAFPILPQLFLKPPQSMFLAAGLVILIIFLIGIYLGKVSRRNILLSALKMAFFGIVIAGVVYLIQSMINPKS
jgi:predicted membrane protein (TIGR00267 family)